MSDIRTYGVSYGNGNDGVSHLYPAFYCRTDRPYDLARLALITLVSDVYQVWAKDSLGIDGEADYTISAMLREGPDGETEFGAAFLIVDVFPDDYEGPRDAYDKLLYANLVDCFGADVVAKFARD